MVQSKGAIDENFDPYETWFEIPKEYRPPTLYQLLGIEPEEVDPRYIKEAVRQREVILNKHRNGPYKSQASTLMYELHDARVTLLDPRSRDRYDAKLEQLLERQEKVARQLGYLPPVPKMGSGVTVGEESGVGRLFALIFVVMLVGLGGAGLFYYRGSWSKLSSDMSIAHSESSQGNQKANGPPTSGENKVPSDSKTSSSESKSPDDKSTANSPDNKSPDGKSPDDKSGENKGPDNKTPEKQTPVANAFPGGPALLIAPFNLAVAQKQQADWATYLKQPVDLKDSIGAELRLIPAATFQMGSPLREKDRNNELLHDVTISRPFYIGKFEVTNAEFRQFVTATNYVTDAEKSKLDGAAPKVPGTQFTWKDPGYPTSDQHPVVNVTWNDANEYCKWLSEKEKVKYRLPTEAEWEYVCRAGTRTAYSSGDDLASLQQVANIRDQSATARNGFPKVAWDDKFPFAAPVGKFKPNSFGVHDMHGNVAEWCQDWWKENYYRDAPSVDPLGPTAESYAANETPVRALRGSDWTSRNSRSAARETRGPNFAANEIGFRIVREIPPKTAT